MKQIKKAFSQLNNETLSDAKKQEIFDRILDKEKAAKKTRRNVFAIAAPLAAAAVIAIAVFAVPLGRSTWALSSLRLMPRELCAIASKIVVTRSMVWTKLPGLGP